MTRTAFETWQAEQPHPLEVTMDRIPDGPDPLFPLIPCMTGWMASPEVRNAIETVDPGRHVFAPIRLTAPGAVYPHPLFFLCLKRVEETEMIDLDVKDHDCGGRPTPWPLLRQETEGRTFLICGNGLPKAPIWQQARGTPVLFVTDEAWAVLGPILAGDLHVSRRFESDTLRVGPGLRGRRIDHQNGACAFSTWSAT